VPIASSSRNFNSGKSVELEANPMFFMELLKGAPKTLVMYILMELG